MERRIADNVITVTTPLDVTFFNAWLDFTAPLHSLTKSERQVMSYFLKEHYELSKVISDDAILAQVLSSTQTKQKIMDALNLKAANLQIIIYKFKKLGLMIDGKIKPNLIPAIKEVEETGEFRLMVRFVIRNEH